MEKAEIYQTMDGRYGYELLPAKKKRQGFNTEEAAAAAARIALGHKKVVTDYDAEYAEDMHLEFWCGKD